MAAAGYDAEAEEKAQALAEMDLLDQGNLDIMIASLAAQVSGSSAPRREPCLGSLSCCTAAPAVCASVYRCMHVVWVRMWHGGRRLWATWWRVLQRINHVLGGNCVCVPHSSSVATRMTRATTWRCCACTSSTRT